MFQSIFQVALILAVRTHPDGAKFALGWECLQLKNTSKLATLSFSEHAVSECGITNEIYPVAALGLHTLFTNVTRCFMSGDF